MLKSIESCCKSLDGKVVEKYDYFNSAKGFYVFEQKAHFPNGEYCQWALLDGYFEDEEWRENVNKSLIQLEFNGE